VARGRNWRERFAHRRRERVSSRAKRNPALEYEACHIPGAVFMDLANLVDTTAPVPNTLPSAEKFASRMQSLGLGDGSRIVLYDDSPVKSATRAWFMLTMFGAQNVALLDGGIAKWKAEGRPCAQGENAAAPPLHRVERRKPRPLQGRRAAQPEGPARTGGRRARRRALYRRTEGNQPGAGQRAHPRLAQRALCQLFRPDGTWKSPDEIRALFDAAGVDLSRPLISSCGSGMTANVLIFALHLIGKDDVSLYDGSWSEWGADPATPKETGPQAAVQPA
jgi:thiosulfate/3-mercaptopyruvate sulfurtransferase